jgi:filamentous hemagglutinin family protein
MSSNPHGLLALSSNSSLLRVVLVVTFLLHTSAGPALSVSAITSDGSMGTTISEGGTIVDITGGTRSGSNLFHSFGLFSVGTGDTANFLNDSGLATSNIIGRVTGGQTSSIFGTIKTTNFGNAGLFLINPAGWLFGPTASLNVGGSFHVSTADYLKFAGDAKFHADLAKQSTLTTAPVSAFGFLPENGAGTTLDARIRIDGSKLIANQEQTLSVIGRDAMVGDQVKEGVEFTGRGSGLLSAPGGRVNVASVGHSQPGEILLNEGLDFSSDSGNQPLGRILFSDRIGIVVSDFMNPTTSSMSIVIRGGRLELNNSIINSGSLSPGIPGGPVTITAKNIELKGGASISSGIGLTSGTGTVTINTEELTINRNSSNIRTDTSGTGNAGDIIIQGLDGKGTFAKKVTLISDGDAFITASSSGPGNAGNVTISATELALLRDPNLSPTTGSSISSDVGSVLTSTGRGGTITINANTITLDGGSDISTRTAGHLAGDAGNIVLHVENLNLKERATISSNADIIRSGINVDLPAGNAGNITIQGLHGPAARSVTVSGLTEDDRFELVPAGIFSRTLGQSTGGSVAIVANSLNLNGGVNGAEISTSSLFGVRFPGVTPCPSCPDIINLGAAGAITLNVDTLNARNARISSSATNDPPEFRSFFDNNRLITVNSGGAGRVTISGINGEGTLSKEVTLVDSTLTTAAEGTGTGGAISLGAGTLRLVNTDISASVNDVPQGSNPTQGLGNITLTSPNLVMIDSTVTGESFGSRNAGNITLNGNTIELRNSKVTTSADKAQGGNISVESGFLIDLIDSSIQSSVAGGPGTVGGNLNLNSRFVILQNSDLLTTAVQGNGGTITIIGRDAVLQDPSSNIDVSSVAGLSGSIDIQAPITDLSGSLAPLPENVLQATSLLRQSCGARFSGGKLSSLVAGSREGLPLEPGGFMPSPLSRSESPTAQSSNNTKQTINAELPSPFPPRLSLNAGCS